MKGEWIDYNNRIYEVVAETQSDAKCREVLFESTDPKLRYGEPVFISKTLIGETMNSKEIICKAAEESCKHCTFNTTIDDSKRCQYSREHNGACYLDDLVSLVDKDSAEAKLLKIETCVKWCEDAMELIEEQIEEPKAIWDAKMKNMSVAYEHIKKIVKGDR